MVNLARKGNPDPFRSFQPCHVHKEVDIIQRQDRKYKNLSFTLDEWREIERRADECHMKTASYIKAIALRGQIVKIDVDNANRMVAALSRIGNNVNQITHRANMSDNLTADEYRQLMEWRDELRRISRAYLSTIRSVIASDT